LARLLHKADTKRKEALEIKTPSVAFISSLACFVFLGRLVRLLKKEKIISSLRFDAEGQVAGKDLCSESAADISRIIEFIL
jgi:hypothetical protein